MCRVKSSEDCYHDDSGSLVRKGNQMNAFQLPVVNPPLKGFCGGPIHFPSPASMKKRSLGFTAILSSCSAKNFLEDGRQYYFDFSGQAQRTEFQQPVSSHLLGQLYASGEFGIGRLAEIFRGSDPKRLLLRCVLDESRLSPAASYQREPFPHHLFLYGYDWDERVFKASMFDRTGVYRICRSRSGSFRTPFSP